MDTLNASNANLYSSGSEVSSRQILFSLSTSFSANQNWQSNDYKNFILTGNVDYQYRNSTKRFLKVYQFRGELSYLKFVDSIQATPWYKTNDLFNLSIQWTGHSGQTLKHSYSLLIRSQFTDSWKYTALQFSNIIVPQNFKTEWTGGLMNPATITLGYGLNYIFWNTSYINFAFATINVYTRPRYNEFLLPTEKELARTKNSFIVSDYGFSIQAFIQREFNNSIIWDNKTFFFANGMNKSQVNLDFQNRITFRFLKFLQFRISTYLVYNPVFSYQMQYHHEFLIGIFYENKKKKTK